MVPRLIPIWRIQWCYFLFFVFKWKYCFWENLVQNIKIVILCSNLVPRLIRICRIQWWSFLCFFLSGNGLFAQIWSRKSKYWLYAEIWYLQPTLIQICRIQWCDSRFCFRVQITFFGKFGPKNQNCHFILKFAT